MTKDDVISWAREAGSMDFGSDSATHVLTVDVLQRMCELAAEAERRKHQADIEAWKALAANAEKWRGMAHARHGDGQKVVQEIQREAVELEREACAAACDALVDTKEAARIEKRVNDVLQNGDEEDQLQAMRHQLTVSTFNAGIKSCARAIRARGQA